MPVNKHNVAPPAMTFRETGVTRGWKYAVSVRTRRLLFSAGTESAFCEQDGGGGLADGRKLRHLRIVYRGIGGAHRADIFQIYIHDVTEIAVSATRDESTRWIAAVGRRTLPYLGLGIIWKGQLQLAVATGSVETVRERLDGHNTG